MTARSQSRPDVVIGCDFGSQGLKLVLLSLAGELLGEAGAAYEVDYPRPTWAEQPAQAWLDALPLALAQLRAATGFAPEQVRALGLDAQVDGVVPIDAAGRPLRPAIIWMDRRAVSQCEAAGRAADRAALFQRSGLNLDATHVAPKIRWLAENEPAVYDAAAYFLLPCSYVAYHLTGALAVDYANASSTLLLDVAARAWSPDLCRLFSIQPERLAPLRPASDVLGGLRREAAEALGLAAGTPVTVGTGDEHAACAGAGVLRARSQTIGRAERRCHRHTVRSRIGGLDIGHAKIGTRGPDNRPPILRPLITERTGAADGYGKIGGVALNIREVGWLGRNAGGVSDGQGQQKRRGDAPVLRESFVRQQGDQIRSNGSVHIRGAVGKAIYQQHDVRRQPGGGPREGFVTGSRNRVIEFLPHRGGRGRDCT